MGGGYILSCAEMMYNPSKGLVWLTAPAGYTMNMVLGKSAFRGVGGDQHYITIFRCKGGKSDLNSSEMVFKFFFFFFNLPTCYCSLKGHFSLSNPSAARTT